MFLHQILEKRSKVPPSEERDWERRIADQEPARSLHAALTGAERPRIIAEFKRASPSKGVLKPALDPVRQARAYQEGGAVALSVLTEEHFFQGSLQDLADARWAVYLPVLRKDFLTQEWEIVQSRAWGADAVLLIAAVLEPAKLTRLMGLARELGMDTLVEIHSEHEWAAIRDLSPAIVGINNRDLVSFNVDLAVTEKLAPQLDPSTLCVSESGFFEPEDLARFPDVDGFLIGESLVRSEDPVAYLRRLREG